MWRSTQNKMLPLNTVAENFLPGALHMTKSRKLQFFFFLKIFLGRAGRCMPGVCYHLFSQERFHHFQTYQDAEILRVPIHTLCLQTKMLAPANVSISDYLSKAPEPPSSLIIKNSIKLLKDINALGKTPFLSLYLNLNLSLGL